MKTKFQIFEQEKNGKIVFIPKYKTLNGWKDVTYPIFLGSLKERANIRTLLEAQQTIEKHIICKEETHFYRGYKCNAVFYNNFINFYNDEFYTIDIDREYGFFYSYTTEIKKPIIYKLDQIYKKIDSIFNDGKIIKTHNFELSEQ
jgi:hypothetical protein